MGAVEMIIVAIVIVLFLVLAIGGTIVLYHDKKEIYPASWYYRRHYVWELE